MCFHRLPWFSLWFFREKCKKVKFQSLRQPYSGMYLHFILYEIGIWSESLKDHQFTFGSQILAHLKKKKLALFSPQAQTFTVVNTLVGGRLQCKSGREGRRWPHTRACCPPVPDILSAFLKPNHVWHHCKELFQKGSLWREKADGDELGKSVVFSGFLWLMSSN